MTDRNPSSHSIGSVGLRSEQFQQAIFNAIPEQIAVINAEGRIVETNSAWSERLATSLAAVGIPPGIDNYLELCRIAPGSDNVAMREVGEGVEAVLRGDLPSFQTEYRRMQGSEGDRWFTLTATPLAGGGAVLVHEDVTERKIMEREILGISEYERRQMGRELHDGLCQVLGGMVLSIAVLASSLRKRDAPEADEMARLVDIARSATEQARDLSRSLHPVELDRHGLSAALQELTERVEKPARCEFICPEEIAVADGNVAVSLYRIAQEALTNALRHGRPKRTTITLVKRRGYLVMKIEDDGAGFDAAAARTSGMGLQIMRYRASAMGARLKMRSTKNGGSRISCVLPVH